jgi:XTP/dITP diphosphohydrolase
VPEELARLDGSAASGDPAGPDIGRELFGLVARARKLGLDPETELRAAARRYRDLVRAWEQSSPDR